MKRWLLPLVLLVACLLPAATALADSDAGIKATLSFDPATPVAGQPFAIQVDVKDAAGQPVSGLWTMVRISNGSRTLPDTFLDGAAPGIYRTQAGLLPARDYEILVFVRGDRFNLQATHGFRVVAGPGEFAGSTRDTPLGLFPADQRSLDFASQMTVVLLVGAILALASYLAWRTWRGAPAPLAPAAAPLQGWLLQLATLGAIAQVISGYWDISWHTDIGRDSFFSAPHFGIYGGIVTALLAVSIGLLTLRQGSPAGLGERTRLAVSQYPAMGLAATAMLVQLSSAPLDEAWHRWFGLDISVWSPPHDFLIFGGALAALALAALQAGDPAVDRGWRSATYWRTILLIAAPLVMMNAFLAENEFLKIPAWHVSQTRPAGFYPLFLGAFATLAFGAAGRLLRRPGAVFAMAAAYWLLRAFEVAALPLVQRTPPAMPYVGVLVGAVAFELLLALGRRARREGPALYALAGAAAATALFLSRPLQALVGSGPRGALAETLVWLPAGIALAAATGFLGERLGHGAPRADAGPTATRRAPRAAHVAGDD